MKKLTTVLGLAMFILIVSANSSRAQEQMSDGVYIDTKEQEVYTARQAKMMNYRNEAGKKLKKVKVAPADYAQTDDMKQMYVDEAKKEYYTPLEAKRMNYKNESGAALTQMAEIPEDFQPTDDLKKKN
jgi:hypothetical protein